MKGCWVEIGLALLIVLVAFVFALMSGCTLNIERVEVLPNVRVDYAQTQPSDRPQWEAAIRELR